MGKIVDWSKKILINFSPITNFFRLRFSSFPFPFVANDTYEVVVCHADHTRFWTREKNVRRTVKHVVLPHPARSCPCVLVSGRLSFSSLQRRSPFLIGVCTSRRGTDTLLWCPSQCNVAVTGVQTPPTHAHPPTLPFASALSTSNTKDQHLFLLLRRNH